MSASTMVERDPTDIIESDDTRKARNTLADVLRNPDSRSNDITFAIDQLIVAHVDDAVLAAPTAEPTQSKEPT